MTSANSSRSNWAAFVALAAVFAFLGLSIIHALVDKSFEAKDRLAVYGLLVAAATFALVVGQIIIAIRQVEISAAQTGIAAEQKQIALREITLVEQQGKILQRQESEMNRKARLVMWTTDFDIISSSDEPGFRCAICNLGNRTVEKCVVILLIPEDGGRLGPYKPLDPSEDNGSEAYEYRFVGQEKYSDKTYSRWEFDIDGFFVENHAVRLKWITVENVRKLMRSVEYLYRLVYADGAYPTPYDYEPLGDFERAPERQPDLPFEPLAAKRKVHEP